MILFNIDSKADTKSGRDAIVSVFLKVLNEMQGYCPEHPHIAHMERYLDEKGTLETFHHAFRDASGAEWVEERDAYQFHRDEVVEAWSAATGQSQDAAERWLDGAEESFSLSVENFCTWVKAYLDKQGPEHRLIFLVDEVGQFIGTDTHLMLNLQTITENLGTTCQGRAWVVVTSQEDIDAVLGEMKTSAANDFSKIQGRFKTRLSLSSANVDEVIQERLLAKQFEVIGDLQRRFIETGDILKHQLTFTNCGMTFRPYRDGDDFVKNYPFAPYQFQLVQKIFEAIRKAGATGLHLSRGERSILDAFQYAGKAIANQEVGVLVPLYEFYPSIESFLDTAVKRTIDQAADNPSLEPFDMQLLQVLFLIRYVDEMKGNVDNLVTLCLDQIDADRLALRRHIEESLQRLERETLIKKVHDTPESALQEIQAVLRSNDIGQQTLAMHPEEGNPQAIEDLRTYIELCTRTSRQIILHDMIEKRYAVRPYGWPDLEVLLLLARLLVVGDINLMMDGALLPLDKAYDAMTSSSRRRRITILQRKTSDPKALQNARNLGKDVFSEMGPDGEDTLCIFLRNKLENWRTHLIGYKTLADTGDYPGQDEINDGLTLIKSLLASDESYKFIERINERKNALLDLADSYRDLEHFYEHQKPTWEHLRKARDRFRLNRLEVERDDNAGPALQRMQEILSAPSPYGLIKETEGLLSTVDAVNEGLIAARRHTALATIDNLIEQVQSEVGAAGADASLQAACVGPLLTLRTQVERQESVAHIAQAEQQAQGAFDIALAKLEETLKPAGAPLTPDGSATHGPLKLTIKARRVVEPSKLVLTTYLETLEDVNAFLDRLRAEMEDAIHKGERIQVR